MLKTIAKWKESLLRVTALHAHAHTYTLLIFNILCPPLLSKSSFDSLQFISSKAIIPKRTKYTGHALTTWSKNISLHSKHIAAMQTAFITTWGRLLFYLKAPTELQKSLLHLLIFWISFIVFFFIATDCFIFNSRRLTLGGAAILQWFKCWALSSSPDCLPNVKLFAKY